MMLLLTPWSPNRSASFLTPPISCAMDFGASILVSFSFLLLRNFLGKSSCEGGKCKERRGASGINRNYEDRDLLLKCFLWTRDPV